MRESDLFILRLEDYNIKNIHGEDLTPTQIYDFWSFLNFLKPSRDKTLIARGESDENLRRHFVQTPRNLPCY